jgi:hypothetical protein
MPIYAVTIEIRRIYEVEVTALNDVDLFKWNEGKDNNLPEATRLKLSQAEWVGDLRSQVNEIIEIEEM